MNDYIYVGQVEIDGDLMGDAAFFTEEAAREWMRKEFLNMKSDTNIPQEEWEWSDFDLLPVNPGEPDWKWSVIARNDPYGIRVYRFKKSAGDAHSVFMCQETDDCGMKTPTALYFSEDEAREWMRGKFVEYRDENDLPNDRFTWYDNADEGYWSCGDNLEIQDWEIYKLALPE